jgi:hypothetical protein
VRVEFSANSDVTARWNRGRIKTCCDDLCRDGCRTEIRLGKDFDELIGRYGLMEGDAEVSGEGRLGTDDVSTCGETEHISRNTLPDPNGRTAKRSWNGCIVSFAVRPIVPGVRGRSRRTDEKESKLLKSLRWGSEDDRFVNADKERGYLTDSWPRQRSLEWLCPNKTLHQSRGRLVLQIKSSLATTW